MKLSEAFKAWLPRAYRQPTTHYTEANMEAAFLAGAEAAVRAEREGAEPVAWCTRGFADTFEYAGSLEEAQRNRACYEQWCDSPDMSVPLQQQPEPLYLHPPQASATVPEGMVLVPIEPTESMLESARLATENEGLTTTTWLRNCVYRAMLAAAQSPEHVEETAKPSTHQVGRVEETLQNEHVCVPEGMVMAPVKPTERMLDHAVAFALNVGPAQSGGWTEYARRMWETMVIAAAIQLDGDKAQGVG